MKIVIITALGWLEKRNEEEATFLQGDKLWDSFMIIEYSFTLTLFTTVHLNYSVLRNSVNVLMDQ